jgi:hypothetical protein
LSAPPCKAASIKGENVETEENEKEKEIKVRKRRKWTKMDENG